MAGMTEDGKTAQIVPGLKSGGRGTGVYPQREVWLEGNNERE